MNSWVAICLGIAAWFFVAHMLPARRRPVTHNISVWRFLTFLAALALAAHWWVR